MLIDRRTQSNISINVSGYEDEIPCCIYTSKQTFKKHVDLLLLSNSKNSHCVLIKDVNRFMTNKARLDRKKKHFCWYCLQCFSKSKVLDCHVKYCLAINPTKSVLIPQENEYVNFQNFNRSTKAPFIIYGDFECVLIASTDNINSGLNTKKYRG